MFYSSVLLILPQEMIKQTPETETHFTFITCLNTGEYFSFCIDGFHCILLKKKKKKESFWWFEFAKRYYIKVIRNIEIIVEKNKYSNFAN